MVEVIIAVRGGPGGKTRCAGALGADGPSGLARAMLTDMLSALARAPSVARVRVVTPTPELARLAETLGAEAILEDQAGGLNAAFDLGRALTPPGALLMLLPGDLPLLSPRDIETAVATHTDEAVVLVPAVADGGTGAILLRAGIPLPLVFGADSFRRHLAAVQALGLTPRVFLSRGLGRDIDRPDDIAAVLTHPASGHTLAFLQDRLLQPLEPAA